MSKHNKKNCIIVYTDGSCSGNGKKAAIGGIGIHFPNNELTDISQVFRLGCCTNQRTELFAILTALRYIKQNIGLSNKSILIKTDSQYSIDCITKWVYAWIKNGWKTKNNTPVANKEFIEILYKYYERYDIEFDHVEAHTGRKDPDSIGNARADELATLATNKAKKEISMSSFQKPTQKKNSYSSKSRRNSRNSGSKSNRNTRNTRNSGSKNTKPVRSNYNSKKYSKSPPDYSKIPKGTNFVVELIKSKH